MTAQRIQRVPDDWPLLHLEHEVPDWTGVTVDGLVRHSRSFDLRAVQALGAETRTLAFHCVWGWSRLNSAWEGIGLGRLLDLASPTGDHVTIASASGTYSACLPMAHARAGMLVWARDGRLLDPAEGGPLRYLPPPTHWAYKGVKWASRLTVRDRFVPGFWEAKVADPDGRIPLEVQLP